MYRPPPNSTRTSTPFPSPPLFRALLKKSEEAIASNILSDRLKRLVGNGLLWKEDDPTHKQKSIYSLTEMAIRLVPLLAEMGAWGRRFLPVSEELSIRAELLETGGRPLWEEFMQELRVLHLHAPREEGRPSVRSEERRVGKECVSKYSSRWWP